jgi:hypothetical protein
MDIESQLADGLTKREQAKLDKLIKDEANAANTNKVNFVYYRIEPMQSHIKEKPLKLNELKKLFKENE